MEFIEINQAKFDINKPPKPYPDPLPDRDLNYDSEDKDYSKAGADWPSGSVDALHERCDVDSSQIANHHTLGSGRNQASPGNHRHDGTTSPKVGTDMGLSITGSKGGNAALTSLIAMLKQVMEFTDGTT